MADELNEKKETYGSTDDGSEAASPAATGDSGEETSTEVKYKVDLVKVTFLLFGVLSILLFFLDVALAITIICKFRAGYDLQFLIPFYIVAGLLVSACWKPLEGLMFLV